MLLVLLGVVVLAIGPTSFPRQAYAEAPVLTPPAALQTFPHKRTSFTQGLVFQDNVFWESTGLYGRSSISKRRVATGEILAELPLPPDCFGEGLALMHGRLFQLTWKSRTGFVYSPAPLRRIGRVAYSTEGWGLAALGTQLVMSDGSAALTIRDRRFQLTKRIEVRDGTREVKSLNELEVIQGRIWANVWPSDRIAIIRPSSGRVEAWLDCSGLRRRFPQLQKADVLNGIAFDPEHKRVFVTGKFWPLVVAFSLDALELPSRAP